MNLKDEIKELMAGILAVSKTEIEDDTEVGDIESWDSLNHLKIIAMLEDKYNIHFSPDDLFNIENFDDIVLTTQRLIKA